VILTCVSARYVSVWFQKPSPIPHPADFGLLFVICSGECSGLMKLLYITNHCSASDGLLLLLLLVVVVVFGDACVVSKGGLKI